MLLKEMISFFQRFAGQLERMVLNSHGPARTQIIIHMTVKYIVIHIQ